MSGDLSPNPNLAAKRREVERLVRDFEERTSVGLQGHFKQLVYLASLRDYNTGRYHHYRLEMCYTAESCRRSPAPAPRAGFMKSSWPCR